MKHRAFFAAVATTLALLIGGGLLSAHLSPSAVEAASKPESAHHDGLSVAVQGLRSNDGQLIVLVYDDEEAWNSFDMEGLVGYRALAPADAAQVAHFPELTEGPYAVALHHDINGNGDFDMSGEVPLEGYGLSGATGPADEPSFKRASVAPGHVAIQLHYLVDAD